MWILGKVGAAVLLHQHRPAAVTAAADKEQQQQQQQQQSSPCLKNIFVWKSNLIATCSFAILNHPQPVLLLLATSNQTRDSIEIKSNSNWNQAKLMLCSPIVIAHPNLLMLHYCICTTAKHTVLLSVFWMQVLCEWKWSINIWAHQQNWSMYKILPLTEFLCQPEGFLRCSAKIGSTIIFSRLVDFRGNQHILGTLYAYCEILTPGLLVILTWEGGGDLTV